MRAGVSIVIPNFNGRRLMERNLPSVTAALERFSHGELIVVDDGSRDDSAAWLDQNLPGTRILLHKENRGFAAACTTGIQGAAFPVVILLNTDVEVFPDFIAPLVSALDPPEVFAAGCLALQEDRTQVGENLKIPYLRQGKLKFGRLRNLDLETFRARMPGPLPTLFATGGFMAMKKDLFLSLGGFDPLFEPFYYEDADLCYRAWKRGYRVLLEPRSVVIHGREGSILTHHGKRRIRLAQERNRMLLAWKNLTDPRLFQYRFLAPLLFRAAFKWIALDRDFYIALCSALRQWRRVGARRREEKAQARMSDEEIFRRIREAAPGETLR